jgi:hypothetical protein
MPGPSSGEAGGPGEVAWAGVEADPVGAEDGVVEAAQVEVAAGAGAGRLPEEVGGAGDELFDCRAGRLAGRRRRGRHRQRWQARGNPVRNGCGVAGGVEPDAGGEFAERDARG